MNKRIFPASHKRGVTLMAAGCPLDYPKDLPGPSFRAEQLAGYTESRVYALGPLQTVYVIGLRLETDRSTGTVISEWSVVPPWPNDLVEWGYEPRDIIPNGDMGAYRSLLDSRLMGVLNERRLLRRGYPVEGLLCGRSCQSIPESGDNRVSARLTLVDDRGNWVPLRIALEVIRCAKTRSNTTVFRDRTRRVVPAYEEV